MIYNDSVVRWIGAAIAALAAAAGWCAGVDEPRVWWSGPQVTLLGSPSRDGRWLSFADPATGALGVRDLAGGSWRAIATRPAGSREFAYFSIFSRDGRSVAYAWFNNQGFYELRVAASSGEGRPHVAYRNEDAGFVQPCAWTPDDKQILTLLFRRDNISQIAMATAAGGPLRVLRSLNWVYPKKMDISPDGRWIVYDNFAVEGKPERTIFILSMDGSQEKRLIDLPGNYLFPLWSPDGRQVLFAGDTGGPEELWAVEVQEGQPRGQPHRVTGSMGRFLPLGITNAGELFFGLRTGAWDVYVAPVADATRGAHRAGRRFAGRNSEPAWSPDGKRLAYLSRRGTENFGEDARAIVVLDLASGSERELPARMAHIERIAWPPDGSSLLASGSDGKARGGLFAVRVADGMTTPLVAEHDAPFRGFDAAWAPDGRSIYYLHGETEIRQRRLADGIEATLLHAAAMRYLAVNKTGDLLAVGIGGNAIRITPLKAGAVPRLLPFPGLTELAWGEALYAGRGDELWAVPLDGAPPRRLPMPPDRLPGVSLSPDGRSIAFAAGREQAEVRSVRLPKP
jgi:Tol biopolymer transport system component